MSLYRYAGIPAKNKFEKNLTLFSVIYLFKNKVINKQLISLLISCYALIIRSSKGNCTNMRFAYEKINRENDYTHNNA